MKINLSEEQQSSLIKLIDDEIERNKASEDDANTKAITDRF